MSDNTCICPCCRARRGEDQQQGVGGTISYATEEERNDQRALAERARAIIAKRRSEL